MLLLLVSGTLHSVTPQARLVTYVAFHRISDGHLQKYSPLRPVKSLQQRMQRKPAKTTPSQWGGGTRVEAGPQPRRRLPFMQVVGRPLHLRKFKENQMKLKRFVLSAFGLSLVLASILPAVAQSSKGI